jgi:hypothetical protein
MLNRRNAMIALLSGFLSVAYFAPAVHAQAKPDATGTWKWTQTFGGRGRGQGRGGPGGAPTSQPGAAPASQPGAAAGGPGAGRGPGGGGPGGRGFGQPIEVTATLKQDGEKLTGSIAGMNFQDPAEKVDIKEGSVKPDGSVSFKVTQTMGGQFEITRTFAGKLEGDKITGTSSFEFPAGGFGGPGGGGPGAGGPGAGGPGARGPATQPGGGAPGAGGPPAGGPGFGGRGAPQPMEWVATRQK